MKTLIITGMLTLLTMDLFGQHIILSPLAEKTISGYEYGTSVCYKMKKLFAFGGFYQRNFSTQAEKIGVSNSFYGVLINTTLQKGERMAFYANTRMGFVNKNFLVFVPGVETEIRVFDAISIGIGMSVRRGFLSANTSIKIKI